MLFLAYKGLVVLGSFAVNIDDFAGNVTIGFYPILMEMKGAKLKTMPIFMVVMVKTKGVRSSLPC